MKHDLFEYTTSSLYKGTIKGIVHFSNLAWILEDKVLSQIYVQSRRSHGNCVLTSNGIGGRGHKDQHILLCSSGRKYDPPCCLSNKGQHQQRRVPKLPLIVLQPVLGTEKLLRVQKLWKGVRMTHFNTPRYKMHLSCKKCNLIGGLA